MPTTTPSNKPAASCKKCGKAGFADSTGKMQHERRGDPAAYGGRRADPKAAPPQKKDEAPDREHFLNRVVGGKTGRTE